MERQLGLARLHSDFHACPRFFTVLAIAVLSNRFISVMSCTAFMFVFSISAGTLAYSQQQRPKTNTQLIAEMKANDKQAEKKRQQEAAEVAAEYARDPEASILSNDFTADATIALEAIDRIYPGDDEIHGKDNANDKALPLIKKSHSRGELVLWGILQEYMMARLTNSVRIQSIKHRILHPEEDEVIRTAAFKRSQDFIIQQIASREQACHEVISLALSSRHAPTSAPACVNAIYKTHFY